ncbi:MAG: M42 family metallopeptidase [Chloroflexia bacterium]|nr:M42 family metallopeptidase [Chloroflexia bacterium]
MAINTGLLRALTQTPGIASREDAVRALVRTELQSLVDDITVDVMGNLLGTRRGTGGPRVAIAAHMDEIGFVVRHIDDAGFLRLQRVGGFDPRVLVAQRVAVSTRTGAALSGVLQLASKPIHLQQPGDTKETRLEDLFVDLGLPVEAVNRQVEIGDMVTLDRDLAELGETIVSKALDDRLGVFVMIEALRKSRGSAATVVAVASTQEEVGLRGAMTAAHQVDADVAIAPDVTIAGDIPGSPPSDVVTRLGGGTAIKLMDSSHIPHPGLVDHLRDIAERNQIPFQLEILPAGGTDAASFQKSQGGAVAGTISIPTRYVHTVNEMAHLTDIQASIDLLAAFVDEAGTRSYVDSSD